MGLKFKIPIEIMDIKIINRYTITAGDIHIKPEIELKNHQFRHNTERVKFENESNLQCFLIKLNRVHMESHLI